MGDAVAFCRQQLGDPQHLEERLLCGVVEAMLDRCLSPNLAQTMGLGGDNMTAVLVVFKGGVAYASDHPWEGAGNYLSELMVPSVSARTNSSWFPWACQPYTI